MNVTVLIIDDDDDIRRSLEMVLRSEGYATQSAPDGAKGLEIAKRDRPSLILLDLMMPVMDGREFARHARREPRLARVPVVLLSAYLKELAADPVDDVAATLPKPFELEPLLKVIHDLTGGPRH